MKVLITGANGQLGYWLKKIFAQDQILGVDREEMDITDEAGVLKVVEEFKPDVIIHGAAYTNVDGAETDEKNVFLVNQTGTGNIVKAAKKVRAKIVYVSTDYVFDGHTDQPYQEEDQVNPQSVYAKSKLAGEQEIKKIGDNFIIVRTAWLYGDTGKNFVETMLALGLRAKDSGLRGEKMDEIRVVDDQIGSPTYTKDLAQAIKFLIDKNAKGIFHAVNSGRCSWYDFACEIFRLAGENVVVSPISTEEFLRPAKRPQFSVLNNQKLANEGFPMRSWQEALGEYLRSRESEVKS